MQSILAYIALIQKMFWSVTLMSNDHMMPLSDPFAEPQSMSQPSVGDGTTSEKLTMSTDDDSSLRPSSEQDATVQEDNVGTDPHVPACNDQQQLWDAMPGFANDWIVDADEVNSDVLLSILEWDPHGYTETSWMDPNQTWPTAQGTFDEQASLHEHHSDDRQPPSSPDTATPSRQAQRLAYSTPVGVEGTSDDRITHATQSGRETPSGVDANQHPADAKGYTHVKTAQSHSIFQKIFADIDARHIPLSARSCVPKKAASMQSLDSSEETPAGGM
ncbi:hypothetical protein PRZ48_009583 [Zasmidium cellare]|uniref:Uncharacterized protein n=1 Tax=Zasmidium cellare TaxID=395010 RepID=A0ABR0ECS8_ZASCE|nr:hypothetical protein PRZ48_009583 [Zasmidium cellare]